MKDLAVGNLGVGASGYVDKSSRLAIVVLNSTDFFAITNIIGDWSFL